MPVPEPLEWPAAGAVPEVFTTAHDAVFTQAGLRPGERLLVHGAAGGAGTAAPQPGAAAGAPGTATARRPRHPPPPRAPRARRVPPPPGLAEAGASSRDP